MDTSAAWFLGIAVSGLLVFLVYHGLQTRSAHRGLAGKAAARGWVYTAGTGPMDCDITGQVDTIKFRAMVRRPAGRLGDNAGSAPTVTAVTVDAPRIEGAVIVQPAMPEAAGSGLVGALTGGLFQKILLGDDASAAALLNNVTGSIGTDLPPGQTVLATDTALARRVLDGPVCTAVSGQIARFGPRRPMVVVRRTAGVSVRVLDRITDLDEIEAIARLAVTVARAG